MFRTSNGSIFSLPVDSFHKKCIFNKIWHALPQGVLWKCKYFHFLKGLGNLLRQNGTPKWPKTTFLVPESYYLYIDTWNLTWSISWNVIFSFHDYFLSRPWWVAGLLDWILKKKKHHSFSLGCASAWPLYQALWQIVMPSIWQKFWKR